MQMYGNFHSIGKMLFVELDGIGKCNVMPFGAKLTTENYSGHYLTLLDDEAQIIAIDVFIQDHLYGNASNVYETALPGFVVDRIEIMDMSEDAIEHAGRFVAIYYKRIPVVNETKQ